MIDSSLAVNVIYPIVGKEGLRVGPLIERNGSQVNMTQVYQVNRIAGRYSPGDVRPLM